MSSLRSNYALYSGTMPLKRVCNTHTVVVKTYHSGFEVTAVAVVGREYD